MTTRRWQGDAVAIAQVTTLTPPAGAGEVGITINGKTLTYASWDADAIADKWNLATDDEDPVAASPEFREVSAEASGSDLVLTALTPGKPFIVTTTVNGGATSDERQTLTKENNVTGGTFTVTFDGQTTAAIAYNASAATVLAALEALSNIAPGDVTVTEITDGWQLDFAGTYDGLDVAECTVDSSLLTGGVAAVNEKQQLSLGYAATAVTFQLKRTDLQTSTGNLTTPVTSGDVDTALTALGYEVTCTGGPLVHGSTAASPVLTEDGVYSGTTSFSTTGNSINIGALGTYVGLFRFALDIPQGSNVTAAHLDLTPFGTSGSVGAVLTAQADDSDDPAMYASASAANSASLTTATGTLTTTSISSVASIDITDVVQEIVDRAGWVSGNHIIIHVAGDLQFPVVSDEGTGTAPAMTASHTASASAPIVIEWTGADAGTPFTELQVTGSGTLPTIATIQNGSAALTQIITPATTIPGGQSIPVVATQASRGPNHWADPLNWSGGVVPISTDAVDINHSDVDILYDLDQNAVTLASLNIGADYTGKIGLPEQNADGSVKYVEYRDQYLKIGATTVTIGDGVGNGSSRIRLNIQGNTTIDVRKTGSPEEAGLTALQIVGSADIAANVTKGSVGFGLYASETCNTTTVRSGYRETPTGDVTLIFVPSATCDVLDMSGGTVVAAAAPAVITQTDGDLTVDDGSITSIVQQGGTFKYNGNDTITLAEISGVIDFRQDMRPKTVTTLRLYEGFEYHDPHGVVTWTNAAEFIQCSPADGELDIAKDRKMTLATI